MMVANKIFYLHSHKLMDGTIVTHSHPYDKTGDNQPIKSHHHNSFEYALIQNLGILFFVVFISHLFILQTSKAVFKPGQIKLVTPTVNFLYAGRAPPMI